MLLKNKKGDERYLSPVNIIIWIIVGVAVIIGASIFFAVQGDSRKIEATTLRDKIVDCFSENFDYSEINKTDFDIYAKCSLNKNALNDYDIYYFNVSIKNSDKKISKSISGGFGSFAVLCSYQEAGKDEKNFPRCSKSETRIFDKKLNQEFELLVLAASNNMGNAIKE